MDYSKKDILSQPEKTSTQVLYYKFVIVLWLMLSNTQCGPHGMIPLILANALGKNDALAV